MHLPFNSRGVDLLVLSCIVMAGCTDQERVTGPASGSPDPGLPPNARAALTCQANVRARSVACAPADSQHHFIGPNLIVGGQNIFITMVSTNASYDQGTQVFKADVQVANAGVAQQLGTPDGIQVTGLKVFFHSGPTVTSGSGIVTVKNPDGTGAFTGPNQPYFLYLFVLPENFITPAKTWQWNVPSTVNTFVFSVYVQADVPGESGFVRITPAAALLNPTNTVSLTGATFDAIGRPKAGTVTFTSSDPSVATVNSTTGLVTAVAGGRAVITASTGGPEASGTAVITVDQAGFQIRLRYLTSATVAQKAAFEAARTRWESIITADLPAVQLTSNLQPACGNGPINEFVDDVVINVILGPIDGPGNILGQAGPCAVRSGSDLPAYGVMIFDTADLDAIQANSQLNDVILHEMGHVLGFGSIWSMRGVVLDQGGVPPNCTTPALIDPFFNGALAIAAFNAAGGTGYSGNKVPVETLGGSGTRCGHWRESVFQTELMTGFISAPGTANPLSAISIQSLADLGYTVNTSQANAYTLPCSPCTIRAAGGVSGPVQGLSLGDDIWQGAVYRIDAQGRLTELRPDRRPEALRRLDVLRSY